jgi:glycosyltransferase involved in cell wall biosynthesis
MNNKKICFISCVNDLELYDECIKYLSNIEVPEGYEVENIYIEDAESITKAYNVAMKTSDAKYKVYLHQDVFIRNPSFIKDVIDIFKSDDKIGLMGVIGAKIIPTNAVWWEAKDKYGKVYESHTGQMELLSFNEIPNTYQSVQTIDGLIMMTQYDIPWREETFDGWHFYDMSQSVEFLKAGYEVVIPKQEEPWVIHDCGIVNVKNGYDDYKNIFLQEYSKGIFPLVSILIPTYNQTHYLKDALESAINQTYPNIEIIIGDDSTNDDVKQFVIPYLNEYKNLIYYKNQRNKMDFGISNVENLFKSSKGEYIAYLLHDDIFHVEKVEKMMEYFLSHSDVSLVTSYRKLIDGNGNLLEDLNFNGKLFEQDTHIAGISACILMVANTSNYIGELSTAMFKRAYIEGPLLQYNDYQFRCSGDMALWLNLLEKGDLIYMSECLSYFRQHENQNGTNRTMQIYGMLDSIYMIEGFHKRKQQDFTTVEYRKALIGWYAKSGYILSILEEVKDYDVKLEFINKYSSFLQSFLTI